MKFAFYFTIFLAGISHSVTSLASLEQAVENCSSNQFFQWKNSQETVSADQLKQQISHLSALIPTLSGQDQINCSHLQTSIITELVSIENPDQIIETPIVVDRGQLEPEEVELPPTGLRAIIEKFDLDLNAGYAHSRGEDSSRTVQLGLYNKITSRDGVIGGRYGFTNEFEWDRYENDADDEDGSNVETIKELVRNRASLVMPEEFFLDEAYIEISRNDLDSEQTDKITAGFAKFLMNSDSCTVRSGLGVGHQSIEYVETGESGTEEAVVEWGNKVTCTVFDDAEVSGKVGADWGESETANIYYKLEYSTPLGKYFELSMTYKAQDKLKRPNAEDEGFDRTFSITITGHFDGEDIMKLRPFRRDQ